MAEHREPGWFIPLRDGVPATDAAQIKAAILARFKAKETGRERLCWVHDGDPIKAIVGEPLEGGTKFGGGRTVAIIEPQHPDFLYVLTDVRLLRDDPIGVGRMSIIDERRYEALLEQQRQRRSKRRR